ncbi:hypothetical protein FRB99_004169 [Tulasnella sp. 403]|nr:hypothetical protein FRB99_004169 [Tulasnella sp. 403]
MVRTRPSRGSNKPKPKQVAPQKPSTSDVPQGPRNPPPIPLLIEKAQILIAQCNYDLARIFLKRIIERDPPNIEAREMLGLVEIETGNLDTAKLVFQSLIPPSPSAPPNPPPSAYLYLAQLIDENARSALDLYQKGLDLLISRLKGKAPVSADTSNPSESEADLKRMAVGTIVAMVELWMSDLCFEPQAESQCEALLQLALEIDPQNPEGLQTLASVRISQQRPDDARALAEQSWALWKDRDGEDVIVPSISSRIALTRLFLELGLHQNALTILHGVLSEDDQQVEAWYLQGWCFYLMAEDVKDGKEVPGLGETTLLELKQDSRNCLETCKELHKSQEHPDEQIIEHVNELIGELEADGVHASKPGEEPEEWDGINEDEWIDEDEDVDMS